MSNKFIFYKIINNLNNMIHRGAYKHKVLTGLYRGSGAYFKYTEVWSIRNKNQKRLFNEK